jgi:hypothetical protein
MLRPVCHATIYRHVKIFKAELEGEQNEPRNVVNGLPFHERNGVHNFFLHAKEDPCKMVANNMTSLTRCFL